MFSFYAIWFGLDRIYTFGVSYLFLMVVLHLGYMNVVFTSPLLGLCLSKAPLNVALRNRWPFCWQIPHFLLSPHSKFLSSEEHPAHSDSHAFLWAGLRESCLLPDTTAVPTVSHLQPLSVTLNRCQSPTTTVSHLGPLSVTYKRPHGEYRFSSNSPSLSTDMGTSGPSLVGLLLEIIW